MSFFKFECPHCHSRVEAGDEHVGMEIDCPHCAQKVTITKPKEEAKPTPDAADFSEPEKKQEVPAKEETLVSFLTTELKHEFVEEVRQMIKDPAKWIPGRDKANKLVMAAKVEGETVIPVPPEEGDATHYSVIGAFQKVMADRKVVMTASGRSRLLTVEIPDAAAKTLKVKEVDPMTLDHSQCLAMLDTLDDSYNQMKENREVAAKPKANSSDPLNKLLNTDGELEAKEIVNILVPVIRSLQDRVRVLEDQLNKK